MSQYKLIRTEESIKSEQQLFILLKDLSLRFHVIVCKSKNLYYTTAERLTYVYVQM